MGSSAIGEIPVIISGDWSELQSAIDSAAKEAQAGAQAIAQAFQLPNINTDWAEQLQAQMTLLVDSTQRSAESLEGLGPALDKIAGSGAAAAEGMEKIPPAEHDIAEGSHEAAGGLAELGEKLMAFGEALAIFEGLKEILTEAFETFGNVEKATISLTALTGSAEKAEEALSAMKSLSLSDALSFPALVAADQHMTALGFDAEQIVTTLKAAADAAAATGNSFDKVTSALDRMALTGKASGKQLVALGLSANDLAKDFNTDADSFAAAFKQLDQSDRLAVLTEGLKKYQGVAEATAKGILGQWQNLKTQVEFIFEDLGAALAPVAKDAMTFISDTLLPAAMGLMDAFKQLSPAVQDIIIGFTALAAAAVPVSLAVGGLSLAIGAMSAGAILPVVAGFGLLAGAVASVPFVKLTSDTETARFVMGTFTGPVQEAATAMFVLDSAMDAFSGKASTMEGPLGAMAGNIARIHTAGQGWINDMANQAQKMGQLQEQTMKINEATDLATRFQTALAKAMDTSAQQAQETATKLATFGQQAFDLLQSLPTNLDTYIVSLENGGKKASELISQINAEITKAVNDMSNLKLTPGQVQGLQEWIDQLSAARAKVQALADDDSLEKLGDKLQALADKFPEEVSQLDHATQTWMSLMEQFAASMHKAKDDTDPSAIVANLLELSHNINTLSGTMTKSWQGFTESLGKGLTESLAEVGAFSSQTQIELKELGNNWLDLATKVKTSGAQQAVVFEALKALKIDNAAQDQREISALQAVLGYMQQMKAPLAEQLAIKGKILQDELDLAAATGQTAEQALAWQQQLTAVQIKQNLLKEDTMALANLYADMVKSFGKAWDDLGKNIGDALVDGQNFGAALSKVFDDLKKSLAELVTNYLLGELKRAFLENTDAVNTFGKVFSGIFGGESGGGLLKAGFDTASKASEQFSEVSVSYFGQAGDAVKNFSQTASSSMSSAANSVSQSAAKMVSGLSVVASVVTAIASIFSAIELMHTNTLLDRIEHETARMAIYLGDSGSNSIQYYTGKTAEELSYIHTDTQRLVANTEAMAMTLTSMLNVMATGGGGGGGSMSPEAFKALQDEIEGALNVFKEEIEGPYGLGPMVQGFGGDVSQAQTGLSSLTSTAYNLGTTFTDVSSTATQAAAAVTSMTTQLAKAVGATGPGTPGFNAMVQPTPATPTAAPAGALGYNTMVQPMTSVNVNVTTGGILGVQTAAQLAKVVQDQIVSKLQVQGIRVTRG